jgi:hypothetical protein
MKTAVKFLVNVLTGTSVSEASKAAKISMTTALYWMEKAFAALRGWQDSIVLSGEVYVDEKYFTVAHSEVELRPDGKRYRGLSRKKSLYLIVKIQFFRSFFEKKMGTILNNLSIDM